MEVVVPIVIHLIMSQPHRPWGDPCYPVVPTEGYRLPSIEGSPDGIVMCSHFSYDRCTFENEYVMAIQPIDLMFSGYRCTEPPAALADRLSHARLAGRSRGNGAGSIPALI